MPGMGWKAAVLATFTRAPLPEESMAGRKGPGDIHQCSHIECDLGSDDFRIFLHQGRACSEPGIVDEGVHGDSALGHFVHEFGANTGPAQVHGKHCDGYAMLGAQFPGQFFETVCAAGY
ncbi:hypothetical protein StoSoilB13_30750 (plasmid) [Arthrobacter sp. StoSoilB13]|nr:hypothetical protein StoSoilB13_30750 [Arthrobacter sp. StoSoilB13]